MADVDTGKIDFERVHMLLNTVHLQSVVGPRLNHIGNAAMTELTELNEKIKVAAQEAEKKLQAKIAEDKAKALAKLEADESASAKAEQVAQRDRDAASRPVIRPNTSVEEPDVKSSVYPGDSETATIADRRI